MKRNHTELLMRIIGSLAGLLAIGMLLTIPFMLHQRINDQEQPLTTFSIIFLFFLALVPAAYFMSVAYFVWFRFSPLAVRHICGLPGIVLFMVIAKLSTSISTSMVALQAFAMLVGLVAVAFVCRACSNRLIRSLFQEDTIND